jgi:hypothetical protein
MNIGEILIWESSNLLLLIPVVIGLVILMRWLRGRAVFTERDWLFLIGHPRERVLSLHLWLRFAVFWFPCKMSLRIAKNKAQQARNVRLIAATQNHGVYVLAECMDLDLET